MNNPIHQYGDIILTTNNGQFQLLIGFIHQNTSKPKSFFHTHNYHELFYVAKGQLEIVFPDHAVTLPENAFLVIPPHTQHYTNMHSTQSQSYLMSYQYTPSTEGADDFLPRLLPLPSPFSREIQNAFIRLRHYVSTNLKHKNELITACFHELLYLFKSTAEEIQDSAPLATQHNMNREYLVYVINEYINQYFSTGITLSDLANLVHLSERQTHRIIQETYGQTFRQKIIDMRIRTAVKFLLETDMTVKTIAAKVGYKTVNSFYEAFDHHHHMTPEQYRKGNPL